MRKETRLNKRQGNKTVIYFNRGNRGGFSRWFREIFRVHSREEYAELFTRGLNGAAGRHGVYPWFYTRLLFLNVLLFAVSAFVVAATFPVMGYMGIPTVITIGAILINAPFAVFLYELYPDRDFGIYTLLLIAVTGAAASDAIINFGYFAFVPENTWLSTLWTAFLEETGKALPALAAIFILKKRDPLVSLIIAGSVGLGMAVCEDMGYIFYSFSDGYGNMGDVVTMAVLRAITAPFSHVIWTAFIGWAFTKFRRPLIDVRFWGMYILSMGLHYLWDCPGAAFSVFALIISLVAGACIFERIIKRERLRLLNARNIPPEPVLSETAVSGNVEADPFGDVPAPSSPSVPEEQEPFHVTYATVYNRAGIAAAITAICLSAIAAVFCVVGINGGKTEEEFTTAEELVNAVQCGGEFKTELSRKYDYALPDYSVYVVEGEITEAVQAVKDGEYTYYYTYDRLGTGYLLSKLEVEIAATGERFECESLYDGAKTTYYYAVAPFAEECYYDFDYEVYVLQTIAPLTYDTDACIALAVLAGVACAVGFGLATAFYFIDRKRK